MDKWVKNLNEKDLQELIDETSSLGKVPEDFNTHMLNKIENGSLITQEQKTAFHKKRTFTRLALAAAILIIFIPASLFYFNSLQGFSPETILLTEDLEILRGDTEIRLGKGDSILEGDVIRTGMDSGCELQIKKTAGIQLEKNSSVIISEVKHDRTRMKLLEGSISLNVEELSKNEIFEVRTHNLAARVVGTQFTVKSMVNGNSSVTVSGGIVMVSYTLDNNETGEVILNQGENVTILPDRAVINKEARENKRT